MTAVKTAMHVVFFPGGGGGGGGGGMKLSLSHDLEGMCNIATSIMSGIGSQVVARYIFQSCWGLQCTCL